MDVGLELQQARERQGVSLQQISRSTKISLRVLQAIETSDPAALPARVFTRSFVKTYAQEVGLHPEITMRRYLEQIEKFEPPAADLTHDTLETPSAAVAREALVLPALFTARLVRGRFGTATVLVLAGLAAFVLAVKQGRRGESRETPKPLASPRVVSSAGISPAGTAPAPVGMSGATSTSAALSVSGTSGTSGTPGASRGSGTPATTPLPSAALHLAIAPTGPCWVQATV
ncbi:MAG TPA: helix-turn-helix domain-containing protein, partial [Vicinamibacterales bacterium]